MIRSFTYSVLADQTLDTLQRVTKAKNKNQLFEPMVEALLHRTLTTMADLSPEDLQDMRALCAAWDYIHTAEVVRSVGLREKPPITEGEA